MKEQGQQPTRKVLVGAYAGLIAFTIASLLGPILWEKAARKERRNELFRGYK